jgi:hypothetical protein
MGNMLRADYHGAHAHFDNPTGRGTASAVFRFKLR